MKKIAVLVIAMMLVLSAAALADPMGLYQAGDQISDFTLELTDGEEFVLSEQVGKVVVVDLWATWCPNCVEYSIPALAYLHANYPEDVAVVAVNCGDPAEDVKAYVENMSFRRA